MIFQSRVGHFHRSNLGASRSLCNHKTKPAMFFVRPCTSLVRKVILKEELQDLVLLAQYTGCL